MIKEIKEDKLKASITVVSSLVFVIGIIITLINSGNTYATSISDYYCSTNGYEVVSDGDNYYCCPNDFSYENNRCQKQLTEEYDYADCIDDGYGFNNNTNYCYAGEEEANKKKYTITYSLYGGTKGDKAPTTAEVGATIQISNPTKKVTITGNANGQGAIVGSSVSKSLTFAGWTTNSGIGLDTTSALTGTSSNPTTSWDGSATKNIYFKNLRTTSGTVTMNATWKSTTITLPTVTKEGHTCGWNDSSSGTTITYASGASYTINAYSNSALTLYAVCNKNQGDENPEPTDPENPTPNPGEDEETPTEYTLTYDANGGNGVPASSKTGIVSSTKPTRTGYTFVNWNTKKDGTGTSYASGSKYTGTADATLYAQWKANEYKISYTLNGGIATGNPTTGTYDSVVEIKNPTKTVTVVGNVNKTDATISKVNPVEQKFAGWTSTTINISTAYYGEKAWTNGNTKVTDTKFKNLTPVNGGTVTMVANWEPVDITLPTIVKEGYTCKWNTKSDGKGTDYSQGEKYTVKSNSSATINMYAICEENTKTDEEITDNKKTGDVLIVLAWIVGIGALGYSVYYFKSRKFDM